MVTDTSKFTIVAVSRTVDALATAPGLPLILAQCGKSLYAINEEALVSFAETDQELLLEDPVACREVLTGVEGEWSLNPVNHTIVSVGRSGATTVRPTGDAPPKRVALPELQQSLWAALTSDDEQALLCITRDDSDPDFARYEASCMNLATGRVAQQPSIASVLPLQFGWSAGAKAFVVFDPDAESLWRLRPGVAAPAQIPTRETTGSPTELVLHPNEPWFALTVQDANESRISLMHGAMTDDAVRWEGAGRLPEGLVTNLRWRPFGRELLCEQALRRRSRLEVISVYGITVSACELPRGWFNHDLAWSGSGDRVYVAGSGGIGTWQP